MRYGKSILIKSLVLAFAAAPALADSWDAPVGYYDSATGTGATLKSQLTTLMTYGPDGVPGGGDDHILRTYGQFRYASILFDTDPNNSNNILLVYNRTSVYGGWDAGNTWNREHVWPQSLTPAGSGAANNSTTGYLGDHHALRPANPSINSSRSNRPFGNYNSSGSYGIQTGGTWYPGDADAGDIARVLFYDDTRYDSDFTGSYELTTGIVGDLATLVHWNYVDPPDDFERRRNQVVYSFAENPAYYQNNRNAFIDHPEYVWSIYGGGNNDSQISAGAQPASDGSSSTTVDLGRVITGSAVPAAQEVLLLKQGADPTYYEVTTSGDATSTVNGRYNTFLENTQFGSLYAGLDTTTNAAGLKSGSITIDNLDVSSSGSGHGSADANDLITVNLEVVDHANASFASGADQNTLTIDFGSVSLGGTLDSGFSLYNLENTLGYTAGLDLDSVIGSGDTAALYSDLSTFSGLDAGLSNGYSASFDTSMVGSFSATYTLNLSDEDIAGATGQVLTLQLLGEVVAIPGDLNGDGYVGLDDLQPILDHWNQNVTVGDASMGDIAGPGGSGPDGYVGLDDLQPVLDHWNEGTLPSGGANIPEPATGLVLGAMGAFALRRRR